MTEWHFSPIYDAEVAEQNDLFTPMDTISDFDESNPPYKFQLLHGLYDKEGNCLSSDIGYLTMVILDNWYTRRYGHSLYAAYIKHDWHLREIDKARVDAYKQGYQAAISQIANQGNSPVSLMSVAIEETFLLLTRHEGYTAGLQSGEDLAAKRLHLQIEELKSKEKRLQEDIRALRAEKQHWERRKMQWRKARAARQKRLEAAVHSQDKSGYVYLIQGVNTPHFKIGKARQIKPRMDTFSVKLPMVIELICAIKTDNRHSLEIRLHSRFASKRVQGEWFALDTEDIAYIQSLAQDT
jgi:hypothetical protein